MPFIHTSQPRPQAPSVGILPVVLDEAHVVLRQVEAQRLERARGRGRGCPAATASARPGTGSSAACGSDSRRSGRPSAGATAARTPRATARGRARAGTWRCATCPRRLPCRRAAAARSPVGPSTPEAQDDVLKRDHRNGRGSGHAANFLKLRILRGFAATTRARRRAKTAGTATSRSESATAGQSPTHEIGRHRPSRPAISTSRMPRDEPRQRRASSRPSCAIADVMPVLVARSIGRPGLERAHRGDLVVLARGDRAAVPRVVGHVDEQRRVAR